MKMEAEMREIWSQAQGHLEPQKWEEAGRTLPGASGGSVALGHLDLSCLVSRTEKG